MAGSGTEPSSGAIAGDIFRCVVQIRQDDKGNVQEVLLIDCNGTEAWRRSLVVAINQSSPLPAPPIPSVFERALTMTFEGYTSSAVKTRARRSRDAQATPAQISNFEW